MPKLLFKAILFACLIFSGHAYADDVGTPEEAKWMAMHAADFLRQNGPDKAFGKDLLDLKDTDGKLLIREFVAIQDHAWVDYKWPDPATKKIRQKTTYVVRVDNYLVGVGAYK